MNLAIDERQQFRVLYRHFLFRVIDIELLSASGDIRNLLGQLAAILAAFSFVLLLLAISPFARSSESASVIGVRAWGVEEFLISTTLTVAVLLGVLAWNAMLPDRRDSYVLNPLPIRTRLVFGVKCAAIATVLGLSIAAVNTFTGLSLPFLVVPAGFPGTLRSLMAYWVTMASAGAFMLAAILAVQSTAALFGHRFFQRVSGSLQLLTFFVVLALFFLTPSLATPARLAAPENQHLLSWLPSLWFLGLFQELNGTSFTAFAPLAGLAVRNLTVICLYAFLTVALTYARTTRRIVEQPDVAPAKSRSILSKLLSALTRRVLSDPLDRAILLFSARTLARSRQHRLIVAAYTGTAFAISLAFLKSVPFGELSQPGAPLQIVSLVMLFFAIAGNRAVFSLPVSLPSNWIFRISAVRRPAAYFSSVRKALFALAAAPVLAGFGVLFLVLWPSRLALQHLLVLLVLGVLLVQVMLRSFRKLPFACSYLPGKSNVQLKAGIVGFSVLFAVSVGANIEYWSMQKTGRYFTVLALLTVATLCATKRTAAFANSSHNRIQFEDKALAEVQPLDLRRDSDYV